MRNLISFLLVTLGFILSASTVVAQSHGHHYNENDKKCIRHCVERNSFGNCQEVGPDFCGYKPRCTPRCVERIWSGCKTWGADYCGFQASCVKRCAKRDRLSLRCEEWAPDACGARQVKCIPHCIARDKTFGKCLAYGPDACGYRLVCKRECVKGRDVFGDCKGWGPDRCF